MKLGPYLYHLNTFNIPNNCRSLPFERSSYKTSGDCFLWVLNRFMGPAKARKQKVRTYWKNYYLKVFLKYLTRLIYHCTIKNFMRLFKFIFHAVHNPRALLFVLCQIVISRFKKMIAQSF